MKKAVPVIAVSVLITLCGGCEEQATGDPVRDLTSGLIYYLEDAEEPIDDKENMARMYESVRVIREKKLYAGIDILLDVWLFYDATDNQVAGLAGDTLHNFGKHSLGAVESRIEALTGREYAGRIPQLRKLKEEIEEQHEKN